MLIKFQYAGVINSYGLHGNVLRAFMHKPRLVLICNPCLDLFATDIIFFKLLLQSECLVFVLYTQSFALG